MRWSHTPYVLKRKSIPEILIPKMPYVYML